MDIVTQPELSSADTSSFPAISSRLFTPWVSDPTLQLVPTQK
jgi:hypothetical protein